jgi:hypothetical protein
MKSKVRSQIAEARAIAEVGCEFRTIGSLVARSSWLTADFDVLFLQSDFSLLTFPGATLLGSWPTDDYLPTREQIMDQQVGFYYLWK